MRIIQHGWCVLCNRPRQCACFALLEVCEECLRDACEVAQQEGAVRSLRDLEERRGKAQDRLDELDNELDELNYKVKTVH